MTQPEEAGQPTGRSISLDCPAKINLRLKVGPSRDEWGSRHQLDTIYSAISLHDRVDLTLREPGSGFALTLEGDHLGDLADGHADPKANLAVKALLALAGTTGHQPDVSIHITKRIPVGAGLAGGSTDAAGTLLGLNKLWGLGLPMTSLEPIAADLGADLPFCLHGGICKGADFGQKLTPLDTHSTEVARLTETGLTGHMLIGAYEKELSTARVYRTFDEVGSGHNGLNDLELAACTLHPRSGLALDLARGFGAGPAFISGSGPSVVAMVPEGDRAATLKAIWEREGAVDWIIEADSPVAPVVRPVSVTH